MWFKKNWNKLTILLISIVFISSSIFMKIDKNGEELVEDSLQEAIMIFGVAKGLNAAVSLAQGTEITPPGITLTIGEVLDPINDLVEQFSWIMLASITSLGIQKILMNVVTSNSFNIILISAIALLNIWLFVRFRNDMKLRNLFFKVTVILIFLRFSIPVMSIMNSYIYQEYIQNDFNVELIKQNIQKSSNEIDIITYNTINEKKLDEELNRKLPQKGWLRELEKRIGVAISNTQKFLSIEYYKHKINSYKKATEKTSKYIIDLIIAFVFKTIFFPLLFLFMLYQLLRNIFNLGK